MQHLGIFQFQSSIYNAVISSLFKYQQIWHWMSTIREQSQTKEKDWKMFSKIFHMEINLNLRNPRLELTKQEPKRRRMKEKTLFGQQGEAWMPMPFQTSSL